MNEGPTLDDLMLAVKYHEIKRRKPSLVRSLFFFILALIGFILRLTWWVLWLLIRIAFWVGLTALLVIMATGYMWQDSGPPYKED